MKKRYILLLILFCLFFAGFASAAPAIPTGRAISLPEILTFAEDIGGFLIALGMIVAMITIIGTGFMYLMSGSNPQRVTTAKNMFKAGIIGALIIFGSGTIITAIRGFVSDPFVFFGGGGGGGGVTATCQGGLNSGIACVSSNPDCPNEATGTCGGAGQPLCSYSLCY